MKMRLFVSGLAACMLFAAGIVSAGESGSSPQVFPRVKPAPAQVDVRIDVPSAGSEVEAAEAADDSEPVNTDPRLSAHELDGIASWYGGKFQGRLTANGETFDTNELTAAHKTLPFDTIVNVVNLNNEKTVEVRINDRGPFVEGRVIDLSRAGAEAIGMSGTGVAPVRVEVLHYEEPSPFRTLQIGAFGDLDNAEQLVIELSRAGVTPEIESTDSGIYRVVVPQVHSDDLEDTRSRLATLGYPDVLVRSR